MGFHAILHNLTKQLNDVHYQTNSIMETKTNKHVSADDSI